VFKVRLLEKVLGISSLCVLFKDKFTKVVKIAKDVIRPLCVLFKEGAVFTQLIKKSAKDVLRPVYVLFKGVFIKIAKNIIFCQAFLTLLRRFFTPFSNLN
jgi:hypothetical protein